MSPFPGFSQTFTFLSFRVLRSWEPRVGRPRRRFWCFPSPWLLPEIDVRKGLYTSSQDANWNHEIIIGDTTRVLTSFVLPRCTLLLGYLHFAHCSRGHYFLYSIPPCLGPHYKRYVLVICQPFVLSKSATLRSCFFHAGEVIAHRLSYGVVHSSCTCKGFVPTEIVKHLSWNIGRVISPWGPMNIDHASPFCTNNLSLQKALPRAAYLVYSCKPHSCNPSYL